MPVDKKTTICIYFEQQYIHYIYTIIYIYMCLTQYKVTIHIYKYLITISYSLYDIFDVKLVISLHFLKNYAVLLFSHHQQF